MKKLAAVLSMVFMLQLVPTAFAEEQISVDEARLDLKTVTLTLSGRIGSGLKGKTVILRLLNSGKTIDDIDENAMALQKMDTFVTADGGEFSFEFVLNTENPEFSSGNLNYYIDCDGSQATGSIYAATDEDVAEAFAELKQALETGTGVSAALGANADTLALKTTLFDAVDTASLATLLQKAYSKDPSSVADEAALQETINVLTLLEAYNESKTSLVTNGTQILYNDILKLDELDATKNVGAYAAYTGGMTETGQKAVIAGLMNQGFTTLEDYYKTFTRLVVAAGIKNPTKAGYTHVRDLLTKNAEYIGLDLTKYNALTDAKKNTVDSALTAAGYTNELSSIQKALDTAVTNASAKTNENNGSTGTVSGGGGVIVGNALADVSNSASDIFNDLGNHEWAKASILRLYDKGIVSGIDENTFDPNGKTTREQFVKMFISLIGAQLSYSDEPVFTDMGLTEWYAPYITAAKQLGISEGKDDGSFGVGESITRQDAMVMLARGLQIQGVTLPNIREASYIDNPSDYAVEAVNSLYEAGVISGYETGEFKPFGELTRAEAAVIMAKVLDLI